MRISRIITVLYILSIILTATVHMPAADEIVYEIDPQANDRVSSPDDQNNRSANQTQPIQPEMIISTYCEDLYSIDNEEKLIKEGSDGRLDIIEREENTLIIFIGVKGVDGNYTGLPKANITLIIRSQDGWFVNKTVLSTGWNDGNTRFCFVYLLDTDRIEFFGHLKTMDDGWKYREALNVDILAYYEGNETYLPVNASAEANYFPEVHGPGHEHDRDFWEFFYNVCLLPAFFVIVLILMFLELRKKKPDRKKIVDRNLHGKI